MNNLFENLTNQELIDLEKESNQLELPEDCLTRILMNKLFPGANHHVGLLGLRSLLCSELSARLKYYLI